MRKLKKKGFGYYEINIPRQGSSYSDHQLCTFSLPQPQPGHLYTYLLYSYDIEVSNVSRCQCLDALLYELTEEYMDPAQLLSCGDKIDTRLNGKVLISEITITFRSNEAVTRSGASFDISEYSAVVCT